MHKDLKKVNDIYKTLGVMVMDHNVWYAKGVYYPPLNSISIRDTLSDQEKIETMLHELIHWSGHSTRLARPIILEGESVGTEGIFCGYDTGKLHTEEAIAQMGMYTLVLYFNFEDTLHFKRSLEKYLDLYCNQADLVIAESEAKRATEYIINLIEQSKREVA